VVLDDCNFHECVRLDEFESSRTLTFLPPDGEFALLNYRVTGEFRCPFRIFPSVEEVAPYKVCEKRREGKGKGACLCCLYIGRLRLRPSTPQTDGTTSHHRRHTARSPLGSWR
jgi:hypothetical protein